MPVIEIGRFAHRALQSVTEGRDTTAVGTGCGTSLAGVGGRRGLKTPAPQRKGAPASNVK